MLFSNSSLEMFQRIFLVCVLIATVFGGEFASKKFESHPVKPSNLFTGTFHAKLDHFRAQDDRTFEFVSIFSLALIKVIPI